MEKCYYRACVDGLRVIYVTQGLWDGKITVELVNGQLKYFDKNKKEIEVIEDDDSDEEDYFALSS